jgi:hypothetical protein
MDRRTVLKITEDGIIDQFINLYVGVVESNGDMYIATPMTLVPFDGFLGEATPTVRLNKADVQNLLDNIWALGYRPKDIGTAGHLAATTKHLNDMRKLVEHHSGAKLDG